MTALREGSIENLIKKDLFLTDPNLPRALLGQMLKALDYLAFNGIVHRDVKPANILYQSRPDGGYIFQLTDFGLCNSSAEAQTWAGSPTFMAPEFLSADQQTPKVDVWSLYVTLAWALNAGRFRQKRSETPVLRIQAVHEAANDPSLAEIREMAIVDPALRASAADMLDKLFNGEGRTTPKVVQGDPVVARQAAAPRPHRVNKKVAPKRHGEGFEGVMTRRRAAAALQHGIIDALQVQGQPNFNCQPNFS